MASVSEVRSLVGDDDSVIAVVIALRPTVSELEEALTWASGAGDVLGSEMRPLTGKAAQIFDILTAEEDDEP